MAPSASGWAETSPCQPMSGSLTCGLLKVPARPARTEHRDAARRAQTREIAVLTTMSAQIDKILPVWAGGADATWCEATRLYTPVCGTTPGNSRSLP